jgi:ubiquinone/menaquinone biosynthesis C-methylase UbiE
MPKDRGIDKVEAYFGDFVNLIENKIKKQGKVKILDAGCGYGVAMMGFVKRFGNNVELAGYNYSKKDGDLEIMKEKAIEKGIFTKDELKTITNSSLPKIIYLDASKKLPFKDHSFDFIYSMASLYLYDDKIHFLEECSRILKKDGIARISPSFSEHKKIYIQEQGSKIKKWIILPEGYRNYWEIWDKGKEVKIWNYCNRIKGVKAVWKNRGNGDKPMYIEIHGNAKVNFNLRLVSSIDLNFIWKNFGGVKSIYTTQLEGSFRPRYKIKNY